MTDNELEQMVEKQLLLHKKEIVEALKVFQADTNAVTFKDAENIPDELVGKSLDSIIGTLLRETSLLFRAVPSKKMGEPRTPALPHPAEARQSAEHRP